MKRESLEIEGHQNRRLHRRLSEVIGTKGSAGSTKQGCRRSSEQKGPSNKVTVLLLYRKEERKQSD